MVKTPKGFDVKVFSIFIAMLKKYLLFSNKAAKINKYINTVKKERKTKFG